MVKLLRVHCIGTYTFNCIANNEKYRMRVLLIPRPTDNRQSLWNWNLKLCINIFFRSILSDVFITQYQILPNEILKPYSVFEQKNDGVSNFLLWKNNWFSRQFPRYCIALLQLIMFGIVQLLICRHW